MTINQWMVFFAGCFLSANVWATAPTLTIGKASGHAGSVVDLPVNFDSGTAPISAIQFNLTLPAMASISSVDPGEILVSSGKTVSSSQHGNTWTFIIFGLNQNASRSGNLLTAKVKLAEGTAAGAFKVSASGIVYSDPNGRSVPPGSRKAGTLTVN